MDELDLKILYELSKDSQQPFYEIAKKIGVSPRTIELRFRKLCLKQIILRSTILVDLKKIGYAGKTYLSITTKPGTDKKATIDSLRKISNIFLISSVIGDFDILALSVVKGITDIIEIRAQVRKLPGIDRVDISFVPNTTYPANWIQNQSF